MISKGESDLNRIFDLEIRIKYLSEENQKLKELLDLAIGEFEIRYPNNRRHILNEIKSLGGE